MPRETTEARPPRIAPLVAYSGRAIGAEKSTYQQHDLSNLIVGPNQLQYRLSRATKPKSRYKTNTFCPLTLTRGAPGRTDRWEANDPLGELITDKQKRRGANLTVDPSAYPINTVHVRPNSSSENTRRRGHYGRRHLSLYASTVGSQPCQNDNTT